MASTDLIRDTECPGTLHLTIFLGLLLQSVFVSGQSTVLPATSGATKATISGSPSPTNMMYGYTADASTSGGTATTPYTSLHASNSGASASKTQTPTVTTLPPGTAIIMPAQTPAITASPGYRASSDPSPVPTLTSRGVTSTVAKSGWLANAPPTSEPSVSTASSRAVSAANTGNMFASAAESATVRTSVTSSPTQPSSSATSGSSSMSNSTAVTWGMTGTTVPNNASRTMIYCPTFMCNYSDCYMMYTSQNTTLCTTGYDYCQLIRQTDMCYTVSCSASCSDRCINASHTNCSVDCCNYTDCLNDSFASMMTMMTTTPVMSTSTMTKPTTRMTTNRPITADNGNKCHQGRCTGTNCYTTFGTTFQTCSSTQPHCQLKKESKASTLEWTAGCTTNCSEQTPCKASTRPPCHLECCNANAASCLWLNGSMNMPNSATGGPCHHRKWVAIFLGLLVFLL